MRSAGSSSPVRCCCRRRHGLPASAAVALSGCVAGAAAAARGTGPSAGRATGSEGAPSAAGLMAKGPKVSGLARGSSSSVPDDGACTGGGAAVGCRGPWACPSGVELPQFTHSLLPLRGSFMRGICMKRGQAWAWLRAQADIPPDLSQKGVSLVCKQPNAHMYVHTHMHSRVCFTQAAPDS